MKNSLLKRAVFSFLFSGIAMACSGPPRVEVGPGPAVRTLCAPMSGQTQVDGACASSGAPRVADNTAYSESDSLLADSLFYGSPGHVFLTSNPPEYIIHQTDVAPQIDGRLSEKIWREAPSTDAFVDIRGARPETSPLDTRVQMVWDNTHLYIGARLAEPQVWATLTEKNAVIFHDNDFEVFLDPDGDNHNYHELEINALGTFWELTLEKPYRDGGPYHIPHNLDGLRAAVHVNGTLNDPTDIDTGWTVEIAIPLASVASFSPFTNAPKPGTVWRLNFSRVEWPLQSDGGNYSKIQGLKEHNWVWSPTGIVDIHRPDRWGIAVFTDQLPNAPSDTTHDTARAQLAAYRNEMWTRDWLLKAYYYAGHFKRSQGQFPPNLDPVNRSIQQESNLLGLDLIPKMMYQMTENGYVASLVVPMVDSESTRTSHEILTINQSGKIQPSY